MAPSEGRKRSPGLVKTRVKIDVAKPSSLDPIDSA